MNTSPADATETIFAYGTLRDAPTQRAVFGRAVNGVPDVLDGYRLSSIQLDGATYPIAHLEQGAAINGVRYTVTRYELSLMDAYEGEAYQRIIVRLRSGSQAWVYVAAHQA